MIPTLPRTRHALAATLVVIVALTGLAGPAQAHPTSQVADRIVVDTTQQVQRDPSMPLAGAGTYCGSSYSTIATYAMRNSSGTRRGTYIVGWNGTRNCGVAECYTNCGTLMERRAWMELSTGARHSRWNDVGMYRYYAGPVYSLPSTGECIDFGGHFGPDGTVAWFIQRNAHCG